MRVVVVAVARHRLLAAEGLEVKLALALAAAVRLHFLLAVVAVLVLLALALVAARQREGLFAAVGLAAVLALALAAAGHLHAFFAAENLSAVLALALSAMRHPYFLAAAEGLAAHLALALAAARQLRELLTAVALAVVLALGGGNDRWAQGFALGDSDGLRSFDEGALILAGRASWRVASRWNRRRSLVRLTRKVSERGARGCAHGQLREFLFGNLEVWLCCLRLRAGASSTWCEYLFGVHWFSDFEM